MDTSALTLISLGFDPIDAAHRALHDRLKFLTPERCTVEDIIGFKRDVDRHFAEEEAVLHVCPQDVRIRHIEAHRSFHDAICDLHIKLIERGGTDRYELDCLETWFLVHTSTYDAILVQSLREAGLAPGLPDDGSSGKTIFD